MEQMKEKVLFFFFFLRLLRHLIMENALAILAHSRPLSGLKQFVFSQFCSQVRSFGDASLPHRHNKGGSSGTWGLISRMTSLTGLAHRCLSSTFRVTGAVARTLYVPSWRFLLVLLGPPHNRTAIVAVLWQASYRLSLDLARSYLFYIPFISVVTASAHIQRIGEIDSISLWGEWHGEVFEVIKE